MRVKRNYGAWGHWGAPYFYLMDERLGDGEQHTLPEAELDIKRIEENLRETHKVR